MTQLKSATVHRTIKIKPVNARTNKYIDFNKENNKESPNLKLVMMQEYQNEKIFWKKAMFQIGLKKFQ